MRHCHDNAVTIPVPQGAKKIVLAGNPNSGKSVFFNYLTGLYADVSNYPGTTLEISTGRFGPDIIMDTPGVYGLSSFNDEERIARDIILGADIVINIVNAVNLERDLFLTQQIIDTGVPVLVALNMMDEAAQKGLRIDVEQLATLLGTPVFPTSAVKNQGLTAVRENIYRAVSGNRTPGLGRFEARVPDFPGNRGEALLYLEGDPVIAQRYGLPVAGFQEEIYQLRRERVNSLVEQVFKTGIAKKNPADSLSRWTLHPWGGWVILALALWGMYQFIGVLVAGTVVNYTEKYLMAGKYEPLIRGVFAGFLEPASPLGRVFTGEFGLFTMTVTYLIGLLLPLVIGFYLFLSILEDTGYLPRVATLVDRAMNAIGLNGRAVIPIILGFGCVTVATITTRLLGSEREKRIAIFLLGLAIPCSAQLGVIAGLLSKMGPGLMLLYLLVIFAVLVLTGSLLKMIIPGRTSDLLIDLPALRMPRLANVLKKTLVKSWGFLAEAAPLFALGSLLISVLQITGVLAGIQKILEPITTGWLGLPAQAASAFIMGVVRRDFGAAGLSSLAMTPLQTAIALVTITLFVPCIASVMIIFKERSKKEAALMWLSTWIIAFFTGGVVNQLAKLTGGNIPVTILIFTLSSAITIAAGKLVQRLILESNKRHC
ncbi:MAG: ferrous iron transport protein B [Firmicutes bacterium]|nr:ferrous iron transport protein B [Bacillota bacterium]